MPRSYSSPKLYPKPDIVYSYSMWQQWKYAAQALLFTLVSSSLSWQSSPRPRKLGRHEGCSAWGKQVPKGSFLLFLVLPSSPFLTMYLFKWWIKRGDRERVVYTSQLEADRTFYNQVTGVWESAVVVPRPLEIPPFPALGPICGWPKGSPAQTHICCLKLPHILSESGF